MENPLTRLRDKQADPAWKRNEIGLRAEMAKLGHSPSDKWPSSMGKAELHNERKKLRATIDSMSQRAKEILDAHPPEKWTKDVEGKIDNLYATIDVASDFVRAIDRQLDLNDRADDTFADLTGVRNSDWRTADGRRVHVLSNNENFSDLPGYRGRPSDGGRFLVGDNGEEMGFGEYIRGMVGIGKPSEAVRNTLSEGTDSAGGFTVPTYLLTRLIDRLRAKTVCIQAGARTVMLETLNTSIARLATDPAPAWRAENASVGGSDPVFEKITFTARSLACQVKVSYELLQDSLNMETALYNAFAQSMAGELDRVAMFGSGTPPEPKGFFNDAGINSVSMGTNGAQLTSYGKILDLFYELQLDNAPTPSGLVMHPRTWRTIQGFVDTTGQPLLPPPALKDIPQFNTTSVPINQTQGTANNASPILGGDFTTMMFGIRSELRIEVSKERFIDNLQYAFVAHLRYDVQFEHPEALGKLIGIIP